MLVKLWVKGNPHSVLGHTIEAATFEISVENPQKTKITRVNRLD